MSIKKSMRLFGIPYQFTSAVDPRIKGVSSMVGNKYMENIITEAPICTFIPGEPKYLPSENNVDSKVNTTAALLENVTGFNSLTNAASNAVKIIDTEEGSDGAVTDKKIWDDYRLYDFKRNYVEYMKYVNVLCRAGATFLELNDKIDGVPFQQYDWKNYRQTAESYQSAVGKVTNAAANAVKNAVSKGIKKLSGNEFLMDTNNSEDDVEETENLLTNYNYVQFYIDSSVNCDDSMTNATSESQLKSMFDSGSNLLKDIAFMMNSGGMDSSTLDEFANASVDALNSGLQTVAGNGNTITTALTRVINLSGSIIKGDNIIMPDIYQSSSYSKTYNITVHLKTPYGTKLGYYMDIFVPMMHLIALGLPRQASSNTYSSPFLVKAYVDGIFSCNLGIVTSISISRAGDTFSADGLPNEVDVSLSLQDLYSDLSMSSSANPLLFVNNSSLIEYIATNCGMSLTTPTLSKKFNLFIDAFKGAFNDIGGNLSAGITQYIDNEIIKFTSLTG